MYLVVVVFNDILFALNQHDSAFKSLLTAIIRLGSEVAGAYTVENPGMSVSKAWSLVQMSVHFRYSGYCYFRYCRALSAIIVDFQKKMHKL